METPATTSPGRGVEGNSSGLFKKAEQRLPDIIQGADRSTEADHTEIVAWFYWIPCPGTRYYSYAERPAPIDRGNRPKSGTPAGCAAP
jgi:hypothetical protein